jgi:ubiquinone/menaquinone biosynthesis C-methylase UbiE
MKEPSFFDKYPHEYDWLTDEQSRLPKHDLEVQGLIKRFAPKVVLDAGCGTGLTSFLFASHGVKPLGIDRSQGMLGIAEHKYADKGHPLSFKSGRFEALPKNLAGRFDLVVCLANSISGVETRGDLRKVFKGFRDVLAPNGNLVLQLLNINSVKDQSNVVIRTTEHGDIVYLRYLSRRGSKAIVSIIRLDTSTGPATFEPFVHEHEPFDLPTLKAELAKTGFRAVTAYADLTFKTKFRRAGRDLVMVAHRV